MRRFPRYAAFISVFIMVVACNHRADKSSSFSDPFAKESANVDPTLVNHASNPHRSVELSRPPSGHKLGIFDVGSSYDWICDGLRSWGLAGFCYATTYLFDQVPEIGWTMNLQLHNYPLENDAPANYTAPTCIKFTITLSDKNSTDPLTIGLLRRVDADWNDEGAMPTRTRSGTNKSVLTINYELKDTDTADLYIGSVVPEDRKTKPEIRVQIAQCAAPNAVTVTAADVTITKSQLSSHFNQNDGQVDHFQKDLVTTGTAGRPSIEFYVIERPYNNWWFDW